MKFTKQQQQPQQYNPQNLIIGDKSMREKYRHILNYRDDQIENFTVYEFFFLPFSTWWYFEIPFITRFAMDTYWLLMFAGNSAEICPAIIRYDQLEDCKLQQCAQKTAQFTFKE